MRFFRIFRAVVTVLSLMMCLAIVVIWVRSHFTADHFRGYATYNTQNHSFRSINQVQIGKGGIGFNRIFWSAPVGALQGDENEPLNHFTQDARYPDFRFRPSDPPTLGFKLHRITGSWPDGRVVKVFAFIMPLWCPFTVFLLLAVGPSIYRVVRRRRRLAGNCPKCGYDLRASPERCPECGREKATLGDPSGATVAR